MLCLPDSGFQPSVREHNGRLDVLVDWIEGSVAFIDEELSQTDVVDVLCENDIYQEQDFASERVTDAWIELERRAESVIDGAPFKVVGRRIRRRYAWDDNPAYSFCLLLSLQALYKGWAKQFGNDFTEQGDLFEKLTAECLEGLGWTVHRTGWAPGNAAKIKAVVENVSAHIGEPEIPGELVKWIPANANEEGLDVVCSDPFCDGWGGRPLYFFQCASGVHWSNKLRTPNPETWRRVISFTTIPQRGFSLPFALLEADFRRSAGKVNGMFMDRFRLQSPSVDGDVNWASKPLATSILKWMRPRVRKLPDDRN